MNKQYTNFLGVEIVYERVTGIYIPSKVIKAINFSNVTKSKYLHNTRAEEAIKDSTKFEAEFFSLVLNQEELVLNDLERIKRLSTDVDTSSFQQMSNDDLMLICNLHTEFLVRCTLFYGSDDTVLNKKSDLSKFNGDYFTEIIELPYNEVQDYINDNQEYKETKTYKYIFMGDLNLRKKYIVENNL